MGFDYDLEEIGERVCNKLEELKSLEKWQSSKYYSNMSKVLKFSYEHLNAKQTDLNKLVRFLEMSVKFLSYFEVAYEESLHYCLRLLEIKRTLSNNELSIANTLEKLGLIHCNIGNYEKSIEYFQEAQSIRENLNETDTLSYAYSCDHIGYVQEKRTKTSLQIRFFFFSFAFFPISLFF